MRAFGAVGSVAIPRSRLRTITSPPCVRRRADGGDVDSDVGVECPAPKPPKGPGVGDDRSGCTEAAVVVLLVVVEEEEEEEEEEAEEEEAAGPGLGGSELGLSS